MSEINYVYLKDICTVNQGLQIPISERFHEDGPNRYFYITVQFLKVGHLDKFYIENPPKSTICNEDDIIIVRTGSTGQILTGIRGCFHNNFFKVNYDREKVVGKYLYYCLKTDEKQKEMKNRAGITTIPDLNHFMFLDMKIPLPNLIYQKWAADLLDIISQKIELNNKINAELEAMAKLIYDYWFVQFEFPVLNPDGTQSAVGGYKSSGGKMVWNKELKREVPEGWEVGSLLDIATFTNGIACQKYRPEDGEDFYRVIKIREMGDGFTDKTEKVTQSIPEKVIVRNGDILFSWSATLDVKIWTGGTGGLNQHIFKVTSKKYPRTFFYFEVLRYLQYFKMVAELRKTTMGHITRDHLDQSRISIPPKDLIIDLHRKIDPIIQKLIKVKEENQKLSELRDWLLPMLMNGQVRVK